MITEHDRWSALGEQFLGEHNIKWAQRMESLNDGIQGSGPLTLMKSIINDYWADVQGPTEDWNAMKVDTVMSKIYWCWVAWLEATHDNLPKTWVHAMEHVPDED
jgi:hypothetical protein